MYIHVHLSFFLGARHLSSRLGESSGFHYFFHLLLSYLYSVEYVYTCIAYHSVYTIVFFPSLSLSLLAVSAHSDWAGSSAAETAWLCQPAGAVLCQSQRHAWKKVTFLTPLSPCPSLSLSLSPPFPSPPPFSLSLPAIYIVFSCVFFLWYPGQRFTGSEILQHSPNQSEFRTPSTADF